MLLSISNIAWTSQDDLSMFGFLSECGFDGLEVAPTRIFPADPYVNEPSVFLEQIGQLKISSMQSILYGKAENIFNGSSEYDEVFGYTKMAIDFAKRLSCRNVVFGCPKNRNGYSAEHHDTARRFFRELGEYAASKNTVLALEPNPEIYGTNFINTTKDAFDFVREVDAQGLMVNVDLGTIIYNSEDIGIIEHYLPLVNHIHISEPNLNLIEHRLLHKELALLLRRANYSKFVSIEMKTQDNLEDVKDTVRYVYDVFS